MRKENQRTVNMAILALLMVINIFNFIDRQLIASFSNYILDDPDLNITNKQFGFLTGIAFLFFYCLMGLFMGALADRTHRPRLLAAAVTLWSVLTAATGMAKSFVGMLIPRLFIGIGESAATPTSISILADRFPARHMGLVSGIYYLGVPVGVAASLLIVGYLGPLIGWRNCFYLIGGLGVGLAVLLLLIPETRQSRKIAAQAAPAVPLKDSLKDMWQVFKASRSLQSIFLASVFFHVILGAANFDQRWLVEERNFDRDEIAITAGWLAAAGGILGNLFGGFFGDLWQAKLKTGRPMFLFWAFILIAPITIAYRFVSGDNPLIYLGIFMGFFQLGMFYGPSYATVQELTPPHIRATMIAFFILTMNLLGLAFGATGAGIMIDVLIERGSSTPYSTTLIFFMFVSCLTAPMFYLSGKYFKTDKQKIFNEEGL